MLGFYTFDAASPYREYIGTDIPPLAIGQAYSVSMSVSLADSVRFASDGLGVFFYINAKPDTTLRDWIPVTPQIDYTDNGIIADKENWTILTKEFIADSAYTHLVIGAFASDADISLSAPSAYMSAFGQIAYYFIDSVSVTPSGKPGTGVALLANRLNAHVAPNPFKDVTTLTFNNLAGEQYALSVYNAQGSIVYKKDNITASQVTIERNNLPGGFYYYQLHSAIGIAASGKIVAE